MELAETKTASDEPLSLSLSPTRAQRRPSRLLRSMAIQTRDEHEPPFDSVLASGLYPAAVRLAHLAVHAHAHADSADALPVATPEQLSEQVRNFPW